MSSWVQSVQSACMLEAGSVHVAGHNEAGQREDSWARRPALLEYAHQLASSLTLEALRTTKASSKIVSLPQRP